jgi:aminoacylase
MTVQEHVAVTTFRQYLRVRTVQPKPNYEEAAHFLTNLGQSIGLEPKIIEIVPKKLAVVLTWPGSQPNLKSIILNSHIDVVPVFEEQWTQDPFAANKVDGKIYARGAQDMKCVGIQYLEACRLLKQSNWQPKRTIHILFVPDEEIGGHDGMEKLIQMEHWNLLNPALLLDEGLASPGDEYAVFYGERAPWWVRIIAKGNTGHGSQFIPDTAGSKLVRRFY